jgi:nucleoside-diphosphate-sugar epimerase
VLPPEPIGVPYIDARLRAAAARVPRVTLLQPTTTYLENLSAAWSAERVLGDGVVAYPVPAEAPLRWVATEDVALAAARAIEREAAGSYVLPGVAATGHAVAAELAAALGRPVRWEAITPEEFGDMLRPHLGDHAADGTAAMYRMLASSPPAPEPDPAAAREALDWAPRAIAAWARQAYRPLARAA